MALEAGVWEGWEVEALSVALLKGSRTIVMNSEGSEILPLHFTPGPETKDSWARDKGLSYNCCYDHDGDFVGAISTSWLGVRAAWTE